MGSLSPRIVFSGIDDITGGSTGYHDKYGNFENWKETFDKESHLPTWEDVYGGKRDSYNPFRTLAAIDTEREREIGIGEEYL